MRTPRATSVALFAVLLPLTCATGFAQGLSAQSPANLAGEAQEVPDRIVVELAASLPELPETIELGSAFADDSALRTALESFGAHGMFRVFRLGGAPLRDPQLFHGLGMHRHYVIELAPGSDLSAALRAFQACPSIAAARLDGIVRATLTPNDPLYPQQWNASQPSDADIDLDLAWDVSTGSPGVIIAILDTGCDYNHPDLAGALLPGFNFIANNNNAQDDHGHGTSCAGIAAARANNGIGIAGVAFNCQVLPVKVLNAGGSGSWAGVASGVTWAANNGAKVVSMSLTGGCCDAGMDAALLFAEGLDVLCVAATGNSNSSSLGYPAVSDHCTGIGASSPCDERKNLNSCDGENFWGSNFGTGIDVIAPGVQIRTLTLGGGMTSSFNGTSAATPHAAGVCALIRSVNPTLTYTQVRDILRSSSEDQVGPPSEDTPGYDLFFGFGRINAHRAVLAASGATTFCFGDGSGAPPPCGNAGGPDSGCANSAGPGALLNMSGTSSVSQDDLVLRAQRLPLNKPGLVLMGAGLNNGSSGTPFGDGLLCVGAGGVGIFRLPVGNSGPTGVIQQGPGTAAYACGHWAQGCFQPGATWRFQCWYRDQLGPCGTAANLSNALGVTFKP
jgi:subtilisin family serine protease